MVVHVMGVNIQLTAARMSQVVEDQPMADYIK